MHGLGMTGETELTVGNDLIKRMVSAELSSK